MPRPRAALPALRYAATIGCLDRSFDSCGGIELDDAAADQLFALVEDDGLAWGDGALGLAGTGFSTSHRAE